MDKTGAPFSILNTRPLPMGEALQALCTTQGIQSLFCPMIETKPLPFAPDPALATDLDDPHTSWIFISRTAVNLFADALHSMRLSFPPRGKIIAVGPGSRAQLVQHFPALTGSIICPEQANSESLIQLPALQSGSSKKAWLFKGTGGRTLLAEHLKQQDIPVEIVDLYRRCPVQYSKEQVISWCECLALLATSVDIARAILGNTQAQLSPAQQQEFLGQTKWLVLSDRIKQFLISQSIAASQIFICERTDNSSIINDINLLAK